MTLLNSEMEITQDLKGKLEAFLPASVAKDSLHVTLTYAQSLDGKIAAKKGERTPISHQETKIMTHFLRSQHEALLIGITTFLVDNPSLLDKFSSDGHKIRPVILDPTFKSRKVYPTTQLYDNYITGKGLKPIVIISQQLYDSERVEIDSFSKINHLEVLPLQPNNSGRFDWETLFQGLNNHFKSVMVEGGADVINTLLLKPDLVDSLIVTIGPVYLGKDGTGINPLGSCQLTNVNWWHGQHDSVMMATLK